jgi:hypothetical protein
LSSLSIVARKEFGNFLIVSVAYIVCYTLVGGFVLPLQTVLFPEFPKSIGLLFLPHGVRILAAHYFGWKSFLLLLPASYFMWYLSVHASGIPIHPAQPLISLLACILGYKIGISIYVIFERFWGKQKWKILLFGGVSASFLNGLGNSFFYCEGCAPTFSYYTGTYMLGDMLGQLALMLLLMYLLKRIRLVKV